MTKIKKSRLYDVVIIGGGPSGTATAIQLLNSGILSVLIVEKGSYSENRIGESLPPNTNILLQQLGVWNDFQKQGHLPVNGSCSIWGSDEPGFNDYFVNPNGLGWHLDRNRFDQFLANQACKLGAELLTETTFMQVSPNPTVSGFYLQIKNAENALEQIATRFVVDASGMRAVFASKMASLKHVFDRLICVSGFFELPNSGSLTSLTLLEAVEYGWWYIATLPGQRVIAAMATNPEAVSKYKLNEPDNWFALLSNLRLLPAHIQPNMDLPEKLLVSPALSSCLEKPCGNNWLAVGDAASCYDPICSLGIYKSLLTGMEAGKAIAKRLHNPGYSLEPYTAFLENDFRKYKEARDYFYDLENRWPDSPFWKRRKALLQADNL